MNQFVCPECGAEYECQPGLSCGECLAERVKIVNLVPAKRKPDNASSCCGAETVQHYKGETVTQLRCRQCGQSQN